MAATSRTVAGSGARADAVPMTDEAEQQRVYDRRAPTWPLRVASLVIGVLWLQQLTWKLPWNNFVSPGEKINGVTANPVLSAQQPGPFLDTGSGLYHWMVQEAIYGNKILPFYGDLIKNVVLPNWQLFGWLTFFMEATIGVLLLLGLLTRLGGLIALGQSLNLFLGLGLHPQEWIWSYAMLAVLSFIFLTTGAGRVWGLDGWLRPRLRQQIAGGNNLAAWLYKLT